MTSSNYRRNKAFIEQYRKDLKAMFDDIRDIDIKVLNKAVNKGVKVAKENTNVVSGFMRRSWRANPAKKTKNGAEKSMVNSADYSSYVNYGHRIVNKKGETIGWVKGQFMLEKAIGKIDKELVKEFKKEVERVNRKHDK
ncbi:HK97 gp10 family phage protein [Clostridium sp. Cult2]|uniref:HK97 gp10 family phage protein n=1 Tax=Clostridium sp. Cult2 TaxID=2079003 RepID=UPI001F306B4F|nr:HK97 gp10 family phage protein [Clostridium sp. Cult2]MCF6466348.1 hypothetical protein [Clostridium sp. Cult2]